MRVSYKYKIYQNKRNPKSDELFSLACWVYNHCIALHKRYYRLYGKSLNKYQLQKHLAKLKKHEKYKPWKKLSSQSIQQIAEKIDEGYKRFFKRQAKRPPTFKGRRRYSSITFKNTGWSLNGNEFVINAISLRLKFSYSRPIRGNIKTITLKKDALGELWLCFSLISESQTIVYPKTGQTAGIDFGMKTFLTLSDGNTVKSPQYLFNNLELLRKKSRNLSKKKKGSNNRRKAKLELARLHRKVNNLREEFQWKEAHKLLKSYDTICIEDLNMKAMQMLWGRKIGDLAFSNFVNKLEYLAEKHNKKVVKIDRFFPSSKTCYDCGHVHKELHLKDRSWVCPECGTNHQRDLNAAKNIRKVGTSTFAGEVVRPALAG